MASMKHIEYTPKNGERERVKKDTKKKRYKIDSSDAGGL